MRLSVGDLIQQYRNPLPLGGFKHDSLYIVLQIVTVQAWFYFTLALFVTLFDSIAVVTPSLGQIFSAQAMTLDDAEGLVPIVAYVVSSVLAAVYITFVVERSKLCLDFSVTLGTIHTTTCAVMNGFPSSTVWWMCIILSTAIVAILAESLCVRRELRDVPAVGAREGQHRETAPPPSGSGSASSRAGAAAAAGTGTRTEV
eukprot:TRINITY_DN47429_c0_g1_i1.p1 TRINITY_DN47429_c0_g1~~TRINITY_DN47429_c0_g1_i1.p1  ORF type:complete len:200 (-),score=23.42 TRINITY_DN47429_c0_g1_i1:394-993(-)